MARFPSYSAPNHNGPLPLLQVQQVPCSTVHHPCTHKQFIAHSNSQSRDNSERTLFRNYSPSTIIITKGFITFHHHLNPLLPTLTKPHEPVSLTLIEEFLLQTSIRIVGCGVLVQSPCHRTKFLNACFLLCFDTHRNFSSCAFVPFAKLELVKSRILCAKQPTAEQQISISFNAGTRVSRQEIVVECIRFHMNGYYHL